MHSDHTQYLNYNLGKRLTKSLNMLSGIIEGIVIDQAINEKEINFLNEWLESINDLKNKHPYNELIPVVKEALSDNILTTDEKQDILWLCEKFSEDSPYRNYISEDIRKLHGVLAGIISDGIISETELKGLRNWLSDHEHLKTCWPYDEIDSLITTVMADGKIDDEEQQILLHWFSEFVNIDDNATIINPPANIDNKITGIFAVDPEITFKNKTFCLTGASTKYKRTDFVKLIEQLGGKYISDVSSKLDYLIVGAEGNPCWQYACYGRKVEKAVNQRKGGSHLLIIHEIDFHDTSLDYI